MRFRIGKASNADSGVDYRDAKKNIGTFEAMNENEMMAVSGGARSKSARRAAVKAAKKNFTKTNVKSTVGGMSSYAGVLIGVASVCACPASAPAWVGLGLSSAGFVCSY